MDSGPAWHGSLSLGLSRRSQAVAGVALMALAALLGFAPGTRSVAPAMADELDAPKTVAARVPPVTAPPMTVPEPAARQLMLASFIAQRWYRPGDEALALVRIADRAAARRSLDPVLILAMIAVESGFDPTAISSMGATGLMQIIPEFHPEKFSDPAALFDPETNVFVGTRILEEYLAQSGDLETALQRYAGASADSGMAYAHRVLDEVGRINAAMEAETRRL